MKVKVGIVGLGWWGQQMLRYFQECSDVEVIAACDARLQDKSSGFGLPKEKLYTNAEKMFEKETLDAVVVVTPPTNHRAIVELAAAKGIHIFCEKPMATSIEDCERMIKICRENKVKLMIAFKHRFAKAFSELKVLSSGFGKPLWAMYTYPLWKVDDPGWKFKTNGTKGIVMENMVHAMDALIYLFGDVDRVYAEGNSVIFKYPGIPDSTIFTLRFKNGAIGAIGGGCTSDQRISREYLDVHYEGGIGQISGMLDYPFDLSVIDRSAEKVEKFRYDGSDGVREEIRHFIDCIQMNLEPISDGVEGKKSLQISLAVLESIETQLPVYIK